MDYGVKITRQGKDVSSTDLRDFVLHSGYKNLKAQTLATTTITMGSGNFSVEQSISHNLGYAPMYLAMVELEPNKWYNVGSQIEISDGSATLAYSYTDATNLYIGIQSAQVNSNKTFNAAYYIIVDPR